MIEPEEQSRVETRSRQAGPAPRHTASTARSPRTLLAPALCLLVYLVLVLSGATSSALGINDLRSDPAHPIGTMFGSGKELRADEWLVITPAVLGYMATGSERATTSPLAENSDLASQLPNQGIGERVTFFDSTLLGYGSIIIPQQMLFAAFYWLPSLLLVMFLPPWLRKVGANAPLAWLGTVLVLLAPATAWWSLFPVRILGFTVAACYLSMSAADRYRDRRRWQSVLLAVVAGLLLARAPFFYQPWELTLSVPIVLSTMLWLLWPRQTRFENLKVLAVAGVTSTVLVILCLVENLAAFKAQAGTVYPGRRVSGAVAQGFATLFGAPNLGFLQTQPKLTSANYSEISTGFAVCGIWAIVVWLMRRRSFHWSRNTAVQALLATFLAFWFLWSAFTIPGSRHLPIANLVPSYRSDQTLGFLAVLLLVLVLSEVAREASWWLAAASAVSCGVVTAAAGVALHRSLIPSMPHFQSLIGAVGVGVVIFVVTRYPLLRWPVWVATVCALALVVTVNPVILGFGDLRDSAAAKRMSTLGEQARRDGTYWATNSTVLDGLVIANGVPSLSGHQQSGPNVTEWHKLDPTDAQKDVWNRGSSYLQFRFTESDTPRIMMGGSQSRITVSVNPCRLSGLGFRMAGVISNYALPNSCLKAAGTVMWSGKPAFVYTLRKN